MNRTFSIIKPDATKRNITGAINKIIGGKQSSHYCPKKNQVIKRSGRRFYSVHRDKPFFNDLIDYMTSGPVIIQVLEGDNAIENYRKIMGSTNPENADKGTIREKYALNIQENSVHGSDSIENANIEISYFFEEKEIIYWLK